MSWRCEHGFHAWRFVSMGNRRWISIPGHSATFCRLIERCKRCRTVRTTPSAPVPKRLRIDTTTETNEGAKDE